MRRSFGIWLLLALLLALSACGREEVVPELPEAQLRNINLSTEDIVLSPGQTAELPFTVKDASYAFSLDAASPDCPVRLIGDGGVVPEEVVLQSLSKGSEEGRYVAVLADAGTGSYYELSLRLAIYTGANSFVASSYFTVKAVEPVVPDPWQTTGLPVVYVDTEGGKGIYSKEEYVTASMHIDGAAEYPGLEPVACSIRGRGNTTWTWPKKPYLIKLDSKTSILGLPKHKRWVLLANFMDRTLMRNMVSMHVAQFTSLAWTPHCVPVELVLNGKHQGSYLLIEQVRVDKNRVDITEMSTKDNEGDAVTGGYLLELDFHYDNEFQWKERNIPFAVKNPDPEDLTTQQKTYIKGYIKEVSDVIYGSGFKDPEKGYTKYLDVDSFIDYWIVYEVMCNHELGNPGSVYFHKDRGGLLTAGPCWDFDWGVLSFYTSNGEYGLVNGNAIWYGRLFQDPAFKSRVKARFEELLPQLETIPDYMDECEALLEKSARLNFAMWNPADDKSQNGGYIINGDENLSFHDAIQRLKYNYSHHLEVIRKKL